MPDQLPRSQSMASLQIAPQPQPTSHTTPYTSFFQSPLLFSASSSLSSSSVFSHLHVKQETIAAELETKAMGSTFPLHDFMPVGFRFRPTDEELVNHYLKHKLQGDDQVPLHIIPELDLCKLEPWEIPATSVIKSDDPEWFFFSPLVYKYSSSTRCDRKTKRGFWKATGKDRNIKIRGTNNVIGTKKTLVFHQRSVPNAPGVKTNWVIHEYHAVTFDVTQRNFVVCRLMDKATKNAEREAEGEPSSHMASDYENQVTPDRFPDVGTLPEVNLESIFPAPPQAEEYDFPSIQQSQIGIEQEAFSPNSPFRNAYFRSENSSMQFQFETTEEEGEEEDNADDFVNSILAGEDIFVSEESHAFVHGSTPSESVRRVCHESSDTDAEVVSARYGNILDTSTICNEHASSREYRVSKMVKSSQGAVHGGSSSLSSNHEAREKNKSIFRDDFWGVETSSCDSNADKPLEINCIEISSSPSTLRRSKNQYNPRPDNFVAQRAAARRSTQRKVSSNAVSRLEAKKELPIVESENDRKKAQNTSSRKDLETRGYQSSDVNRKGYFICLETPSSSQGLFPRSVYLVNVVVGILLFIVICWEVLSF